jgi:tetratricopeptide (TPR) repeat protein
MAASAASAKSLRSIRSSAAELAARERTEAGDADAEAALVEALGQSVLAYIDESDRLHRAGRERGRAEELRAAFETIHGPLDRIYRRSSGRIDKLARAVMDEDGDLESLYESAEFAGAQAIAAKALYYLNWLNYYGAMVSQGARRDQLLRECESGFSQFVVGDQGEELIDESLLGRGLCSLELGNDEWALRDFRTVVEGEGPNERKAKAHLALLDAHFRRGDRAQTISYARQLLKRGLVGSDETALVRYYELRALLASADVAEGEEAERYRREAESASEQLRKAGGHWPGMVDALLAEDVVELDPSDADTPAARWQLARLYLERRDCDRARPLLENVLAERAENARGVQREARYWLGICLFRQGDYETAAAELGEALQGEPEAPFAADARYFRFKAFEAMMAVDEVPAGVGERYAAAIRDLVDHHPDYASCDEARYRLGEYLQSSGSYSDAIAQYDLVRADPSYLVRARFGVVQGRFELLRSATDPAQRAALVARVGQDLERYRQQAKAYAAGEGGDVALAELDAKVHLLAAVHAMAFGDGGDARAADMLVDFSARFPGQPELASQASRMRLGALLRARRYAEAEREVADHGELLAEEAQFDALRALAASYAETGRMSESRQEAAAAARVAVALYGLVDRAGGASPNLRQKLSIAQLEEKAGNLDAAATAYGEVLDHNPGSVAALRGLARIAEARSEPERALEYWTAYTDKVRPGDAGWFRGQYEQARLHMVAGNPRETCRRLSALRTAMPVLQDERLRSLLKKLFDDAGC